AFAMMVRETGATVVHAAASPNWTMLALAFCMSAAVQPMRAFAWATTLRSPVGFRSVFAASTIGSFLDTVLPGRLGEAPEVALLRCASGSRWPGVSRAGGSLLTAHLLEAVSFAIVGAVSAFFLPVPQWARTGLVCGSLAAVGGILALVVLNRRLGTRLPKLLRGFVAGAAAPTPVLVRAGGVLLSTFSLRCLGALFVLH